MWPSALTRLFRRGILIIILLFIIFILLLRHLLEKTGGFHFPSLHSDDYTVQRTRPLIWRSLQEHLLPDEPSNRTNDLNLRCRNSVQGRLWMVDDRGFMCQRSHLLPTGCCDVEVPDTRYYTCDTCNELSHCCGIYENCVSCCLHPDKRTLLEVVLSRIKGRQATLYATVEDQYELCLVKCRTNSHSVEHENKYRDPGFKYCYGPTEAHESQREVSGDGGT